MGPLRDAVIVDVERRRYILGARLECLDHFDVHVLVVSRVAEAYEGALVTADDINVIRTWPGGNNSTSDKVPSEIAYIKSEDASSKADWSLVISDAFSTAALQASLNEASSKSDSNPTLRWGFQLRPDEPRLRCMKLFLDPGQKLPPFVPRGEIRRQLAECGKDAVTVVADYLGEVYKHTCAQLTKRYGDLFMKTTPIEWVLTVPAIWSDAAKDATLSAARRAGMGPEINPISRPEAPAVYALQADRPNQLKAGDNFVICDAGGGPMDLNLYEIKQACPLRIEASVEGSSPCCGAAMLNAK